MEWPLVTLTYSVIDGDGPTTILALSLAERIMEKRGIQCFDY